MNSQKISNILGIVMFSAMILGSISVFLGHLCTNLIATGFFAYLLNIFSSPIIMLFHLFTTWFSSLLSVYFVVAGFFAIGILGLTFCVVEIKTNSKASKITNLVLSIFSFVVSILIVCSLAIHGFVVLSDSSVWSGSWIIIFVLLSTIYFVLKTFFKNKDI